MDRDALCRFCSHGPFLGLHEHGPSLIHLFLFAEGIEPYRPYGISVYATYKHEIGISRTVEAYSRQKGKSVKTRPCTLVFVRSKTEMGGL